MTDVLISIGLLLAAVFMLEVLPELIRALFDFFSPPPEERPHKECVCCRSSYELFPYAVAQNKHVWLCRHCYPKEYKP